MEKSTEIKRKNLICFGLNLKGQLRLGILSLEEMLNF